ncbi:hypothetical protein F4X90_06355 [Candidatus Poribacteria bacterium]|nr:hypothetical protein [Candidatus Poribacteria bacterium]
MEILTPEELQTLADNYAATLTNEAANENSVEKDPCEHPNHSLPDDESLYRSEGMITIDYEPSCLPEPYGTLKNLQEQLHADAERNLRHLI